MGVWLASALAHTIACPLTSAKSLLGLSMTQFTEAYMSQYRIVIPFVFTMETVRIVSMGYGSTKYLNQLKDYLRGESQKQNNMKWLGGSISWFNVWTLRWRHNGRGCVSNHRPHDCLLKKFIQARIKENIKAPRHWLLWWPVTRKMFHVMTSSWQCVQIRVHALQWISIKTNRILSRFFPLCYGVDFSN